MRPDPQLSAEPTPSADSIIAAVVPPPPSAVEAINFHNRMAVRVAFLAAAIGSMLLSLPMPAPGFWLVVSLIGAGFFAVYLYNRRSGRFLSVSAGARMGWLTGIFCFVIATVFFTISIQLISSRSSLAEFYRENLKNQVASEKQLQEFIDILQTPAGLGTIIFASLIVLFIFFTLFPMLGGALGAKVLDRE